MTSLGREIRKPHGGALHSSPHATNHDTHSSHIESFNMRPASARQTRTVRFIVPIGLAIFTTCSALLAAENAPTIKFKKTHIDPKFRAEGVAVGDFNHDGRLDIACSDAYYAAPNWEMVPMVAGEPRSFDPLRYSNCFQAFADDLNDDSWTDVIVVDYPGAETYWLENPTTAGGPWTKHVLTPITNNESPTYLDVDGDGVRELICGYSPDLAAFDSPERRMGVISRAADPLKLWSIKGISDKSAPGTLRFAHGLGVGDINGDQRADVCVPEGWWEQPADATDGAWTFHAVSFGEPASQMHVYDCDGDGDADVLSSSAHALGMWWHEQTPEGFKTHDLSQAFSQTHATCLADMNGDGDMDFVTGKRYWAHGPDKDVDPGAPAVLYWFELSRDGGKAIWTPHPIDDDSGVGTQFEVADLSGDGLLDIAIANKKGVFYFEQVRE